MKSGAKYIGLKSMILLSAASLLLAVSASAQDPPAPGASIDQSNIAQYKDFFPEEFLSAFGDGFGGLLKPIRVNVIETQKRSMYQPYLDYSMKNKGKYTLDAEGYPGPGYMRDGLPFPDLAPGDPDFVTKLMWNYDVRYVNDESYATPNGATFQKRRGEKLQWNATEAIDLRLKNRMVLDPKPVMDNPQKVFSVFLLKYVSPESIKNTMTLSYRYADPRKADDTWLYLPSMRRVIRAESGQRSTPIVGSIQALDDFDGFNGRTPEFSYTLVGEQKVLAVTENRLEAKAALDSSMEDLPFPSDGYEVRDVYVIDITPKDPKYPQSRKRLYMDKELLLPYYAVVWDRAGKLWKIFAPIYKQFSLDDSATTVAIAGNFSVDIQFGMATNLVADFKVHENNFTWNDVTPASLLKRGR